MCLVPIPGDKRRVASTQQPIWLASGKQCATPVPGADLAQAMVITGPVCWQPALSWPHVEAHVRSDFQQLMVTSKATACLAAQDIPWHSTCSVPS